MLAKDLKIMTPAKEILWTIIDLRKVAPRYLVHGLLSKMQDTAEKIISSINYANRADEPKRRIEYITQLLSEQGTLENYIEVCVERSYFQGMGKSVDARMLMLIANIGRQATGWKNSEIKKIATRQIPPQSGAALLR